MTWQEGVGIALVCIGLLGGAYAVAQRPAFWIEFGGRLLQRLAPRIIAYLSRRMTPDEEDAYRRAYRAGRGDEWLRDRMRNRRKR